MSTFLQKDVMRRDWTVFQLCFFQYFVEIGGIVSRLQGMLDAYEEHKIVFLRNNTLCHQTSTSPLQLFTIIRVQSLLRTLLVIVCFRCDNSLCQFVCHSNAWFRVIISIIVVSNIMRYFAMSVYGIPPYLYRDLPPRLRTGG